MRRNSSRSRSRFSSIFVAFIMVVCRVRWVFGPLKQYAGKLSHLWRPENPTHPTVFVFRWRLRARRNHLASAKPPAAILPTNRAARVHGQVAAVHGDQGAGDPGGGIGGEEDGQA